VLLVLAILGACATTHDGRPARLERARVALRTAEQLASRVPGLNASLGQSSLGVLPAGPGQKRALEVLTPGLASGALHLLPGGISNRAVALEHLAARPSPVVYETGRAIYVDAFVGADMIVASQIARMETFYLLHGPGAQHVYQMKLSAPPGQRFDLMADGLWLLDARGEMVLRVARPYGVDSNGNKVQADMEFRATDAILTIRIDVQPAASYPLLLDPAVETEVWVEVESPPAYATGSFADGDEQSRLVFDPVRNQIVTFAEDQRGIPTLWAWDGLTWRKRQATSRTQLWPPARSNAGLIFDPKRQALVLFAGFGNKTQLSDLWTWDGATWTKQNTGDIFAARASPLVAWDAKREEVVIHGGYDFNYSFLQDTWVWDGRTLTERARVGPPVPSRSDYYYSALHQNAAQDLAIYTDGQELWRWVGNQWQLDAAEGGRARPVFSSTPALAWDELRQEEVALGTVGDHVEAWARSATGWKPIAAPDPAFVGAGLTWDPFRQQVLCFGGIANGPRAPSTLVREVDAGGATSWRVVFVGGPTGFHQQRHAAQVDSLHRSVVVLDSRASWSWDGTTWTRTDRAVPVDRIRPNVVTDPDTSDLLVFGGFELTTGGTRPVGDPLVGNGTTWSVPTSAFEQPSPRAYSLSVWDPKERHGILFGMSPETRKDELWFWTQAGFSKVAKTGPWPSVNGNMIWDPGSQTVIYETEGATWRLSGSTWSLIGPSPLSSSAKLVSDPERGQVLAFGGFKRDSITTAINETWVWKQDHWVQYTGAAPPARGYVSMAFDPVRKRIVMFGGIVYVSGGQPASVGGTWLWDGTRWEHVALPPAVEPPPRAEHHMIWDSTRSRVLLVGGSDITNAFSDAWGWDGERWSLLAGSELGPHGFRSGVLVASPKTNKIVGFGGYYEDTQTQRDKLERGVWLLYTRGGSCAAGGQCGSGHCVDGVCCESASCGTCSTCAGTTPGLCSPVRSEADEDTCATKDLKSCNKEAACIGGDAECASGFCADGVCCNGACAGACQACSAALQQIPIPGTCGLAKSGINPRNVCSGDARCNASGSCEIGDRCRADRYASAANGPEVDCAPFKCVAGACQKACSSVDDCIVPAVCSAVSKQCEAPVVTSVTDPGCGCASGGSGTSSFALALVVFGAIARRKRARVP
jgi:MYXO-CTERM domain-containing protein